MSQAAHSKRVSHQGMLELEVDLENDMVRQSTVAMGSEIVCIYEGGREGPVVCTSG
jgi:hypothetical protein